jgi:hypothetical protein
MNKFSYIFGQILQLFSKKVFYEAVHETGSKKGGETLTRDLGGHAANDEVGQAIAAKVQGEGKEFTL